jgi:hypothetical protein
MSPSAPIVLHARVCGRVGRRPIKSRKAPAEKIVAFLLLFILGFECTVPGFPPGFPPVPGSPPGFPGFPGFVKFVAGRDGLVRPRISSAPITARKSDEMLTIRL